MKEIAGQPMDGREHLREQQFIEAQRQDEVRQLIEADRAADESYFMALEQLPFACVVHHPEPQASCGACRMTSSPPPVYWDDPDTEQAA